MIELPTTIAASTCLVFRFANEDTKVLPGPHPMTVGGVDADVYLLSNGGRIVLRKIGQGLLELSADGYAVADDGFRVTRDVTTITLVRSS